MAFLIDLSGPDRVRRQMQVDPRRHPLHIGIPSEVLDGVAEVVDVAHDRHVVTPSGAIEVQDLGLDAVGVEVHVISSAPVLAFKPELKPAVLQPQFGALLGLPQ